MSTFSQNLKVESKRKKDNRRTPILEKCPHAKGWVNRVTIITPRKPNSAKRPIVKVFLRKMGRLTAHIPGIGHTLKKYGKVLIRGRGPRDLPGVRYSCVRGVLDFIGLKKKKRRRSIYGAEQNDLTKIRARRKYRFAIRRAERDRIKKEKEQMLLDSYSSVLLSTNKFIKNQKIDNIKFIVSKDIKKLLNFSSKKILGLKKPFKRFFPYFFYKKYILSLIISVHQVQQIFFFLNFFFFKKNTYVLKNNFKFFFFKKIYKSKIYFISKFNKPLNFIFLNNYKNIYFNFLLDNNKYFSLVRKPYINKEKFLIKIFKDSKFLQKLKINPIFFKKKKVFYKHKFHIFSKYETFSRKIFFKKKIFLNSYVSKKFSKNFFNLYSFFFVNFFFLKKLAKFNFKKKKCNDQSLLVSKRFIFCNNFFFKKLKSFKYKRFLRLTLHKKRTNKKKNFIYFFKKRQENKLKNFFSS